MESHRAGLDRLGSAVEGLAPGYFALVMASGIISLGLHLEHRDLLSALLLGVAVAAFVVLVALTLWRVIAYGPAVASDFRDPSRAFGFFTLVAGMNVLGARLTAAGHPGATAVLLALAVPLWLVLGYVVPWTAVIGRGTQPPLRAANGTWFIWVVASQSVAAAAATLEPVWETSRVGLSLLAVIAWSVGVFLYAAVGMVVALRLLLYDFGPHDLTPPYWVAMGALAITVLAGARIVEMANAPIVSATRGLIAGLTVVMWGFATWLIPVLVAAGWWRHIVMKLPMRYDATLWSVIFPLGMYAVAGTYLGEADHLPIVSTIGSSWLSVAFAAWLIVFVAMVREVVRTVVLPRAPGQV
jgi:tellurite resistance protein TehA-like permease